MDFDFGLLFSSFGSVFEPRMLVVIAIGVTMGIIVGSLPGLTATMGVALLVPFTFGRPALEGIALLMAIYTGAMYGGAISAILIRTPGTPAAAVTVLEGYPMCERGEAGRAMAMALFASFVGGVFGALAMTFASPLVMQVALEFGPVEFCALAIFGLSVIISISGRSIVKGLMVGFFGLLLACIGFDPISGFPRFTFGSMELMEGPPFIATLVGLFAVSEVFAKVEKMLATQKVKAQLNQYLPSWQDIKTSSPDLAKSSVIGTVIGSIPGAGGDIAAFVSYAEAKRASDNPEEFGKGKIEGLAAAECANNANAGGAMIPLLSLGVPGDSVTAVLLGAFIVQGLQPGPMLFKENVDLVYGIFAAMILAQFMMQFIGMAGIRLFAKVVQLDNAILMPIVFVLAMVGSYAMRSNVFDVYVTLGFGVLGYLMQRFEYPVSPILLALILGPMAEANLRRSLVLSDGDPSILVSSPIAVGLLALAAVSLVLSIVTHRKIERKMREVAPDLAVMREVE